MPICIHLCRKGQVHPIKKLNQIDTLTCKHTYVLSLFSSLLKVWHIYVNLYSGHNLKWGGGIKNKQNCIYPGVISLLIPF